MQEQLDTSGDLKNIKRDPQTGDTEVPKSRLTSAAQARSIYAKLVQADSGRSLKRARVRGLVDGNPPYKQAQLVAEGRANQCNVNWRMAEAMFNSAVGAFYDVFSEPPTYATVKLKLPDDDQADYKSRCVTEHFDWLLRSRGCLDFHMQVSQNEMVLFGRGPLVFQDEFDWKPVSILDGALRVPDRTRSDTSLWELVTIEADYQPHELYDRISDASTAVKRGWSVQAVQRAIMDAFQTKNASETRNWEYYQQQLKQDAFGHSYQANTIKIVHFFYKEFNGKVSHKIILADDQASSPSTVTGEKQQEPFLFEKENRYESFNECAHPMYYDHGGGGFHHSVTGMGVKMYSALEFQNRLISNAGDKAFAPKVMLQSDSESSDDGMILQQYTDYAVLKPGYSVQQTPIAGLMDDVLMFNREITQLVASNLSQYRQNLTEKTGNPITAREVDFKAGEQARLGKTQLNRNYVQMDGVYAEMYRRAAAKPVDGAPGSEQIKEFQKRCKDSGVTGEELRKVESVRATRIVGQGSEFTRQQALGTLFTAVLPMLPEDGRDNLIEDVIASQAGQAAVKRYYPQRPGTEKPSDQHAIAWGQVADMKVGVPAVATSTQNPVIFAQIFIQAGAQAVASLEQGAQPEEVATFLELVGQAAAQHLERLKADPSRKAVYDALNKQFIQLAKIHDQLLKKLQADAEQQSQQIQERQQAQMQAMSIRNGSDPNTAIRAAETQAKLGQAEIKNREMLRMKQEKHSQGLALADASTAASINRESRKPKEES